MDSFVRSIKKKYKERLIARENQWPHCHSNKLVKLQLVENQNRGRSKSKSEIKCEDLFSPSNKTPVVRRVLVEGDAGIGKTTLCTSASIDWANGAIFQQFELVLLLPLRDKRVASAGTLPELLKLLHGSESIRTAVANSLEETEGENVLIIADGWDELSKGERKKRSFLYKLLFGMRILPFASVLLTSRPSISSYLRFSPHIDRSVSVVGFNKDNIKEYIESELSDDKPKCFQLLQQLQSNPLIESICSVPLNCAIVCELSRTHDNLPHTMTGLYTNIILQSVFRNVMKLPEFSSIMSISSFNCLPDCLQDKFWSLCEFAFELISKDQAVFTQQQVEAILQPSIALVDELLCFGLVQCVQTILDDEVGYGHSFHFLHLTIQEFLAAYHLARQSPDKQIEVVKSHVDSPHFKMVWRFFFGISCTKSLHKHSKLRVELSQKVVENFFRNASYNDRLLLFHCSFESGEDSIATLVAQCQFLTFNIKMGFLIRKSIPKNAFDCAAILHVISNTESCNQMIVYFSGGNLGDKGIQSLVHTLAQKSGRVKVKCLHLSDNNLTSIGISDLFKQAAASFKNLEDLRLSQNPLGTPGIKELEKSVHAGLFSNLIILNLAESLSNDAGKNAASLASFLDALCAHCHHLNKVDLSKNNLGVVAGAQCVGKALSQLTGYKKYKYRPFYNKVDSELDLSETMLGDEGVCAFSQNIQAACYISRLDISGNDVHSIGVSSLADSISSGMLNIKNLCLNDNPLGLDGVVAVGRILSCSNCQLAHLYLCNCQLTTTGGNLQPTNAVSKIDRAASRGSHDPESSITIVREKLCQMPQNCSHDFQYLCLDKNNFSGKNAEVLAGLMYVCRNVRYISSTNCGITVQSLEYFFQHLHTTLPKLSSWDLKNNTINDEGLGVLIQTLPLFSLTVNNIYLDQKFDESLKLKLTTAQESLKKSIGLRVVRGHDWQSGNEDGGEGHVGTVVEIDVPRNGRKRVVVQWDCGNRGSYYSGGGEYELRIIDHPGVQVIRNSLCTVGAVASIE